MGVLILWIQDIHVVSFLRTGSGQIIKESQNLDWLSSLDIFCCHDQHSPYGVQWFSDTPPSLSGLGPAL